MLFKIRIKEVGNRYYDLTNKAERQQLYAEIDNLKDSFSYTVEDLITDESWADFDADTNLDDVLEVMTEIKNLSEEEYKLFINKAKQRIEPPIDIILNIKNNK